MAGILTAAVASTFSGVTADPYFEYTTLLLPGNGTNGAQNNTFLDSSSNTFTITRNGNTTQGTFSPFSQTGWGNYFDGSGDYLTVPTSADFNLGTGAFTFETWVNPTASGAKGIFQGSSAGLIIQINASNKAVVRLYAVADLITSTDSIALNTWTHIAVARSGTTLSMWINGSRSAGGTVTDSSNFAQTGFVIGASETFANQFSGYMSNLRLVKGTAVYDPTLTSISVPTTPLTAITNTSILTCQANRFVDSNTATTPKTITVNGNPSVVAFSPFNPTASWSAATYGGSGYFDGSGDYLSVADNANLRLGTSAFTIQAWVYRNASGTAHSIIAKGGASTGYVLQVTSTNVLRFTHGTTNVDTTTTIPASAWTHVAAVRTNTSTNGFQLYINGVSSATATVSTDFNQTDALYIGGDRSAANVMNGYISGLKYTNGTAETISVPTEPPTATTNVALLTNFTNAGIYDATSKNDLETVADAKISTAQSKWGGSSMYFDGTGDWLSTLSTSLLQFGSSDFTVECWINPSSLASAYYAIASQRTGDSLPTIGWAMFIDASKIATNISNGTTSYTNTNNTTLSTGVWYHVAMVRNGSNLTTYVNGSGSTPSTVSGSIVNAGSLVYVGATLGSVIGPFNGYINDLRITKGYARYTANFTAPTAAFPTL